MRRGRVALTAVAIVFSTGALLGSGGASTGPIPGFRLVENGPDGGTVWQGVIPGTLVHDARVPPSIVYLPPGFSTGKRYPAVYILHGLPGSPYSVVHGMRLAAIADRMVTAGLLRPFIAVVPAGPPPRYAGEWGGRWERLLIDDVLPWSRRRLPLDAGAAGRTLAGYSAGGFGAIDIGLRHPSLFSTLESWSGYFDPPHDGPFRHAPASVLAAHDPSLIVARAAAPLRRRGIRFFLSVGSTHDRWTEARTIAFAQELRALRLPFRLWTAPGGHDGKFWRLQLPAALAFAVPSAGGVVSPVGRE